jgi:transposase
MPFFKENKHNLELQFEKPNVNFLVDENSEIIKIYNLVNKLDFTDFYKRYPDKGAVAYKPEIMVTIILLSIMEGTFSSRAIEKKCLRDLYYIYVTEYRKPDHSTIARFINKFKKEISGLLPQLVRLAKENKISSFNILAIDGSKFQSASSKKHSMRLETLKQEEKRLSRKLEKILNYIEENDKKERRDEKVIQRLKIEQEKLEERKKKLEESEKELIERQKQIKEPDNRRNHQINIIEPDARMMKEVNANGYNIQLTVDAETEFIVNATVEADRSDNHQFSKQHKESEKILGEDKKRAFLADGGYMSTETMDYIDEEDVNAYINDAREKTIIPEPEELLKRDKKIISEFFIYVKEKNEYICPNKRSLTELKPGIYESSDCSGCIIKELCAGKNERRKIERTSFTERKETMREKLKKDKAIMNYRKSVERVFGNIKWNMDFRRFKRKGMDGARVEISMIVLCLNLKKLMQLLKLFYKLILFFNRTTNGVAFATK